MVGLPCTMAGTSPCVAMSLHREACVLFMATGSREDRLISAALWVDVGDYCGGAAIFCFFYRVEILTICTFKFNSP